MTKHRNPSRRGFLGTTAICLGAVAEFALMGAARAQPRQDTTPTGIGHNPPQEAPGAFAQAVIDVARA